MLLVVVLSPCMNISLRVTPSSLERVLWDTYKESGTFSSVALTVTDGAWIYDLGPQKESLAGMVGRCSFRQVQTLEPHDPACCPFNH